MHQTVYNALYNYLCEYEGVHATMYRDAVNLVTVGIGFLIDPVELAIGTGVRNWVHRNGTGGVTEAELRAEWAACKNQTSPTRNLMLSEDGMQAVYTREVSRRQDMLRGVFPLLDMYPGDAQLGMLCLSWLRASREGYTAEFPNFIRCCIARDWRQAGQESLWRAIRLARGSPNNRRVSRRESMLRMFENAADVDEANRRRPGSVTVQIAYWPRLAPTGGELLREPRSVLNLHRR